MFQKTCSRSESQMSIREASYEMEMRGYCESVRYYVGLDMFCIYVSWLQIISQLFPVIKVIVSQLLDCMCEQVKYVDVCYTSPISQLLSICILYIWLELISIMQALVPFMMLISYVWFTNVLLVMLDISYSYYTTLVLSVMEYTLILLSFMFTTILPYIFHKPELLSIVNMGVNYVLFFEYIWPQYTIKDGDSASMLLRVTVALGMLMMYWLMLLRVVTVSLCGMKQVQLFIFMIILLSTIRPPSILITQTQLPSAGQPKSEEQHIQSILLKKRVDDVHQGYDSWMKYDLQIVLLSVLAQVIVVDSQDNCSEAIQ